MTRWAIYATATGALLGTFVSDTHPRFNGYDWPADGSQTATAVADAVDPAVSSWSTTAKAFVDDPAKVEATLLVDIKATAEQRKTAAQSASGFKAAEYAAKRMEVVAWDMLGGNAAATLAAFGLLPAAIRALRFEYAIADAAKFGDQPANAIARFRAGIAAAASTSTIAAAEAKASADIRAASTAAEKRAAAASIAWP